MLSGVLGKAVLDRWRGVTIGTVSLAALLVFAMAVYRDMDLGVYANLPEAFLSLVGIPPDADVAVLSYSAIYGTYGALTLGAIAIAIGSGAIAGEERRGTIGLLLGNPVSRTHVLLAKAAAMLLLIGLASLALYGAGMAAPAMLDVSITGMHIGSFSVHMALHTALFGSLALALGAWTGRTGVAAGGAGAVLVVSFLAVGLLNLVEGWEDAARAFPWHYLTGSDPLLNGVDGPHVSVLAASCVALLVAAWAGLSRRDLRSRSVGANPLDRLRTNPVTARVAERLAGSARVSRIWVKAISDHQGLLFVVSSLMVLMGALMGPMFHAIGDAAAGFEDAFPEAMLALFGGGNVSTPQGFYQLETFGMVAPIAEMVVTVSIGARALAGEEENRTMGLLLANPVPRGRVVVEKGIAMVAGGVIVGVATFAGVALGNSLGGLGIDVANIAATCALAALIGLLFGSLALLLSAATGALRIAVLVPVTAAVALHVMNAMAEINGAGWGTLSPFHHYLGSDPLNNGMAWADASLLAAGTIALLVVAPAAFRRRDLREAG